MAENPFFGQNAVRFYKDFETESAADFRAKRKAMRLAQGIIDIEDIPQEEYDALLKRNLELKQLEEANPLEFHKSMNPRVQAPNAVDNIVYAVHSGAPELHGGIIDPSFTKGELDPAQGYKARGAGDTKGANRGMAKQLREKVADPDFLNETERNQYQRMLDIITEPENKIRADFRAPFVYEDAQFISASRPSAGVHTMYFGRAHWGNPWTPDKSIFQSTELADDLDKSTGGRGTYYIFRGIENYTIDTTQLLGADSGETALLGKHKPIAGLSGYNKQLRDPGQMVDYFDKEGIAPGAGRRVEDIDLAFTEKVLKQDIEKIKAGSITERELYGLTLAERNPGSPTVPPLQNGPNLEDIRARFGSGPETSKPSQAGLEFLEKEKIRVTAEREAKKIANDLARPATREAIEKEGYLYHFAPNKYAESIAEKGIVSNKDPRAAQGAGKIFYWTDPSKATTGAFAPDIGDGGTLDLYRTKVTPEMLDSFQMDPLIGNQKGVARAVFFEADSFPAEKIGIRGVLDESTGGIKYDPLQNVKQGLKVGQKTSLQTEFKANKIVRRPNAVPVISRSEAGIEVSEFLNNAGRARATMDLLRAGSETSAAVTRGKRGAGALRNAALAANILRSRFG